MNAHFDQLLKRPALIFALLALAACGGGGGGGGSTKADDAKTAGGGSTSSNGGTSTGGTQAGADDPKEDDTGKADEDPAEADNDTARGGGDNNEDIVPPPAAPLGEPKAVTFTSGLENPWGLAFLPDASMLVTERPGRLRHVSADGRTLSAAITGVPAIEPKGQGGLLDVAIDPDFKDNRRIYLSFAERIGLVAGTAVARGVLSKDARSLSEVEVIFRQSPKLERDFHFGGRLAFDKQGRLFVTLGEMGDGEGAQTTDNHHGKVLRLKTSGKAATGNPFAGEAGAEAEIWSLGHRNVQGAAIHPGSGELWTVEHGPQGGDEVNITRAGLNYGWPRISYGCEYGEPAATCTVIGGASKAKGLQQPLSYWTPSIAPSGMAFYTGNKFPEWKGNLFVGALKDASLWRLTLDGNKVSSREALFKDLNERIRDVRQGPDGWLYLLTDNAAGRIVRIER